MKKQIKKTVYEWCEENNRKDILNLWDYDLNNLTPKETGFYDKEKRYLKCERGIHESYLTRIDRFANGDGSRCLCKKCISIGQYIIDKYKNISIDDFWSKNNNVSYFDIAKTSTKKFYYMCPNCGYENFKSAKSIYENGIICDRCSDNISYPEKIMFNILSQLKINFEREYCPNWIKPRRYDFYLLDYKIIIEMDGGLGHGNQDNKYSTIKEQIEIDNYKDKMALKHGLYVIRINSLESNIDYIKENICKSNLQYIFDLSNIDWVKADISSSKSVMMEICNLWNKGYDMNAICKTVKLSRNRVILWLKKCAKYNMCDYNPKERLADASRRNGKKRAEKSIACGVYYKNKLYEFSSALELQNKSLELFGIELKRKSIYKVINEKGKTLHGFKIIKLKTYAKESEL